MVATRSFAGILLSAALAAGSCTTAIPEPSPRAAEPDPAAATVRFGDVASEVGLSFVHGAFRFEAPSDPVAMMSGGVCWLDYDDDGWMDLFVVNSYARNEVSRWDEQGGLPASALYRNDEGRFTDVTAEAGVGVVAQGMGCVAADFDGDRHTDLYVTSGDENHLLWNEGNGTFTEGGRDAGVQGFAWHSGAVAGDLNGDGLIDLFVAGYVDLNNPVGDATLGFPNSFLGQRDLLYLNQGGRPSTFREVGRVVGLESSTFDYGLGAAMEDFDGDGDLDLYVVNETNPNRLYENVPWPGGVEADPAGIGFRFAEVGAPAGVADVGGGMGVSVGDLDGSGTLDLFVTNFNRDPHAVFAGLGGLSFADVAEAIGVPDLGLERTGWGASLADFDLDTDLDLVIASGYLPISDLVADAQPLQFLRNETAEDVPGAFEDVSAAYGIDALGPRNARGLATADYDNDGDPDVAINIVGGPLMLLQNSGADGYWLVVAPAGAVPGTTVVAELGDGRRLTRAITAGGSYLSTEDPRALIGLGTSATVARLTIRWPDGARSVLVDVVPDRVITVGRP